MDQARTVETGRLREAMDTTRASIRDTVDELKDKVSEAVDWRHYVNRYPEASLALTTLTGLFIGRRLGAMIFSRADGSGRSTTYGAEEFGDAGGFPAAGTHVAASSTREKPGNQSHMESSTPSPTRRALSTSWSRAGSRLENILNRLIDEVSDTVESLVVPALVSRIRGLWASGQRIDRTGRREEAGGRRDEPSGHHLDRGVYPGGPAGSQAYPAQAARGSERE